MAQTKVQYINNESDPVRLFQYIFSYEYNGNYILFNFHNQHSDSLKSFSFIVKQFDKDGVLLVKNKMNYDNLFVKENSFFVPKLKLVFTEKCDYIEVEVDEALFEESYYFEGKVTSNKKEEVEDEKVDPVTHPYFFNNKKLLFQKPIITFFFTILFSIVSFLVLYLMLNS